MYLEENFDHPALKIFVSFFLSNKEKSLSFTNYSFIARNTRDSAKLFELISANKAARRCGRSLCLRFLFRQSRAALSWQRLSCYPARLTYEVKKPG